LGWGMVSVAIMSQYNCVLSNVGRCCSIGRATHGLWDHASDHQRWWVVVFVHRHFNTPSVWKYALFFHYK